MLQKLKRRRKIDEHYRRKQEKEQELEEKRKIWIKKIKECYLYKKEGKFIEKNRLKGEKSMNKKKKTKKIRWRKIKKNIWKSWRKDEGNKKEGRKGRKIIEERRRKKTRIIKH